MHCPFHIFNERHGELLFCRFERVRLFSAAPKRGIRILHWGCDNVRGLCWVAHAKICAVLFPLLNETGPTVTRTLTPSVTLLLTEHSHIVHSCKEKRGQIFCAFTFLPLVHFKSQNRLLCSQKHVEKLRAWLKIFESECLKVQLLRLYLDLGTSGLILKSPAFQF